MPNEVTVIDQVRGQLEKMAPQFAMALPPQVPLDRFVRVTMTAIQNSPDLLGADRRSLFGACMKAAQDGLLPDGREAALVIFGEKVQYMPMMGGILKKVRNSGELSSITAQIVKANDSFRYFVDSDGEHIEHEPLVFGDRGDMVGAYALAKTKDGSIYVETMRKDDIDKVRAVSRAKNNGPWVTWYEEMAKKTVMRRLSKRLPMSTDLDTVIRRDDDMYDLKTIDQPSESSPVADLNAAIKKRGRGPGKPKPAQEPEPAPEPAPEPDGDTYSNDEVFGNE